MKKLALLLTIAVLLIQCGDRESYVMIETDMGDMKVLLYNSTPKHRDNMLKLAEEDFYKDLLFHRVIKDFMIQGGDPDSRNAPAGQMLGQGGPGYQIDAEIGAKHFKGTLSAARLPDGANPEKKSSGSQFFIVQGYQVSDQELDQWAQRKGIEYTSEQRKLYREVGGYPFLDEDYTVFGEVIEGLEVIDKLAAVRTGAGDRPVQDVKMNVRVL